MPRNLISQAVDSQERTGVERLRDTGRLGYQAAVIKAPVGDSGIADALLNFGHNATKLYGTYKDAQKSRADERSNEIIRKLTPEQRRAAIANGTLLYQDDPDAMEALRFKTGRNAAFEVETEIRQGIAEGKFKTAQELSEYRNTRLEAKAQAYAESVGIDAADPAYQRGFNADIVQRNAAVYDEHARKLSEQTQAIAQMELTSDIGSFFSDESYLRSPTGPAEFAAYLSAGIKRGDIPTEGMAIKALQDTLAQNAAQPGADVFFQGIGDQEISLYGKQMKIRDIVGPEVLENYQVKSGEAAFKRNRDMTQRFDEGLNNATLQPDPHQGLSILNEMQGQLQKVQDSSMVTSQTEALNAARARIMAKIAADSAQRKEALDKQRLADNRMLMFETKYAQRELGDNVSTDFRTFETNPETTGEFKEEDAANFAVQWLSKIDRMSLPEEERDRLKLQRLRADYENGPFRKHFQTLTSDAVAQFNGLVSAESAEVTDDNTGRIREFQRIYKSDPAVLAAMYPEQAAMAERLSLLEGSGIGLGTIIDADRRMKGIPREEQILMERKWAELLTSSESKVPYVPANLRNAARTLYDSELYRTGDERHALNTVNQWLDKTTVGFAATGDKQVGRVQKATLMVDPQDATSWNKGQEIINGFIREIAKQRPWINEGDITIQDTPNGIVLSDPLSSLNIPPITTQQLQQEYQIRAAAARREAEEARRKAGEEKIGTYKAEQGKGQWERIGRGAIENAVPLPFRTLIP